MKGLCAAVLIVLSLPALAADVHVHVSPNSKGTTASTEDFPTIQMALDHAPEPTDGGRLFLHIAPGTYRERVWVSRWRAKTTLLGEGHSASEVVITASQNAKSAGGTFFSQTVEVLAEDFQADNITFANEAGNTGQAVAVSVQADRAIFKHCRFLGDQDTLFANYGRQYYVDSYIEGGVDFIFGNAAAVFEGGEVHIIRPGYVTAQSRTSESQKTGYVFLNVKLTAADLGGKPFYLGRPWRPYSRVVWMESELPASLSAEGWSAWNRNGDTSHTFYAEYNNKGEGAKPAQRVRWSHALSSTEVQLFQPKVFLLGSDNWNAIAEASRLP